MNEPLDLFVCVYSCLLCVGSRSEDTPFASQLKCNVCFVCLCNNNDWDDNDESICAWVDRVESFIVFNRRAIAAVCTTAVVVPDCRTAVQAPRPVAVSRKSMWVVGCVYCNRC